LDQLQILEPPPSDHGSPPPGLLLGELFERGEGVVEQMGAYQAIKIFKAAPMDGVRGDVYVLYAKPGSAVLREQTP